MQKRSYLQAALMTACLLVSAGVCAQEKNSTGGGETAPRAAEFPFRKLTALEATPLLQFVNGGVNTSGIPPVTRVYADAQGRIHLAGPEDVKPARDSRGTEPRLAPLAR